MSARLPLALHFHPCFDCHSVVISMMNYVYAGCCNCLSRFKPRYKRLVDNIYPANPDVSLKTFSSLVYVYFFLSVFHFIMRQCFADDQMYTYSISCEDTCNELNFSSITLNADLRPGKKSANTSHVGILSI